MKQLLILSGKGGTGKTTIASSFIKLSQARAYADCDVDAPNLHLTLQQSVAPKVTAYYGMPKAEINEERCVHCGLCKAHCKFDAISGEGHYKVEAFRCEGCSVCEAVCKVNAISLKPAIAGEQLIYVEGESIFSTAQLKMGSGTSGKLVTQVKKSLKESVPDTTLAIIDGSPGIGCPVIASISGVDMVLIVAEPSLSGMSDMKRIIKTAQIFGTSVAVCINKYDTYKEGSESIKAFCKEAQLSFVGEVPYDKEIMNFVNQGATIAEADIPASRAIYKVYEATMKLLFKEHKGIV